MKKCYECNEEKPYSEFNKKGAGLQNKCRICQKKYYKNYYNSVPKEKDRILAKNKLRKQEVDIIIESIKNVPCVDCGNRYPSYVMDFDHIDENKKFTISSKKHSRSRDSLVEEILKCEIVCSNCHRIRTHNRMKDLHKSGN
jgi:hypothetical protein